MMVRIDAMTTKAKLGECAYCGDYRDLTKDHVPPRSLFGKPRPALITVPCCNRCNKGFQQDDEYFLLMIKAGIDKKRFPNELADSIRAINSLARPESRGLAMSFLQHYERGQARHHVDLKRIEKVLHRIVRGLFYHHINVRLLESVPFQFVSISDSPSKAAAFSSVIAGLDSRPTTIGNGVFRYAFEQELPFTLSMAWLFTFYDHRKFLCLTTPTGLDV
jgi:hypothetical protein